MQLALQIVLIVSSVLLVLLILLHRGRGGGLSTLFGGGVQSSLSGSSVVEKNLDRMMLSVAAIWIIARSSARSATSTFAVYRLPSEKRTSIFELPLITWLLVKMRPSGLIRKPDPRARVGTISKKNVC